MATTSEAVRVIDPPRGRSTLVEGWRPPDGRRTLQLALASLWLLDAVLQFQPYMFTRAFGNQMIAGGAVGNPSGLAHQITWAGRAIGHHAMVSGAVFALVQLVIALGIAWRPTVKYALAASVAWSLAVWWIGEALGRVLTAAASPVTGEPGAVILYALLAVLLWPTRTTAPSAPFVAARPVGAAVARAVWLVLWGSMSYYSLLAANRAPQGLHHVITTMAVGQPHWLASLDHSVAGVVAHRGLLFSILLAVVFAVIAVGVLLPVAPARATIALAVVVSIVLWVVGEGLGDVFSGSGTDPNTGPLLILLALAFWPRRVPSAELAPAPARSVPLSLSRS